MSQFRRILALDYGTQRIGVAVSAGSLAEPLKILQNTPDVFTQIKQVIEEEQPEQILVGISENQMAELTKQFVQQLKQYTQLPIEFMDETLSSATVHEKLYERQAGKQKYKGPVDHYAAAEFLQEWLDTHSAG